MQEYKIEVQNSKVSPGNQLRHYSPNKQIRAAEDICTTNQTVHISGLKKKIKSER